MLLQDKLDRIEKHTEDFSISKYNFLKISALVKLIKDSETNAADCKKCSENVTRLEEMIDKIPYLDDISYRSPYEKEFNKMRKHFHKEHGYIPPLYFSGKYVIYGAVAGLVLSALTAFLIIQNAVIDILLIGTVAGLSVGYIAGSLKEKRYRKENRIV
ncbi:MAG TPA: hypothetical protein VJ909_08775 [Prolixibacteraceae bacterium]|nr:hypothetical protein [Prolixibacteraceae bacterium]